jgi:hypothetical protein
MKDVINRGTAAQAQAWGFKNVPGKSAIAGKTGTSRDGWFAGFTPEIVCVVYVGFDDNDDLGMKGSDSAMPIWADFMQGALRLHPEWNGDWQMPATIRKAEIDIRNGALIRELDGAEDLTNQTTATPTPTPKTEPENPSLAEWKTEDYPQPKEVYVTDVPAEFRRTEIFIGGTLPNRAMLTADDGVPLEVPSVPEHSPTPTGTPIDETWQDSVEPPGRSDNRREGHPARSRGSINVIVCPVTNMRATINCPRREARSFPGGSEPKEFCPIHSQ